MLTELKTATLGDLLVEQRTAAATTVAVLSEASGLTIEQVKAVESSRHDLTPTELRRLLAAYDFKRPFGRFCRPVIEISLEDGWVTMRPTRQIWTTPDDADENLVCYLSLLHRNQGLAFGAKVPLKSVDLSLLRAALAIRRDDVKAELGRRGLSLPKPVQDHGLLVVAASGVALAAGAMLVAPGLGIGQADDQLSGAPILAPAVEIVVSDTVQSATTAGTKAATGADVDTETAVAVGAEPESRFDIGTALKVDRAPETAIIDGTDTAANQAVPTNPDIEIGTPIVIDRPAGETDHSILTPSQPTSRGPPSAGAPVSKGRN